MTKAPRPTKASDHPDPMVRRAVEEFKKTFERDYGSSINRYRQMIIRERIRVIWSVFNGEQFDRIVLRRWWIYRQECYLVRSAVIGWRDVPMFRRAKR